MKTFLTNYKKSKFCKNFKKKFLCKLKEIKIITFPDGEKIIKIEKKIKKEVNLIFIIKGNINIRLIELIMILDVLKEKKINLIMPYFPYSRQDKKENGSFNSKLISKIINKFKLKKIITFDLHSEYIKFLYNCKFINIKTTKIINKISNKKTIVFTDIGSYKRFGEKSNKNKIIFEKNRNKKKVKVRQLNKTNKKNRKIIIIDDIIDSGKTFKEIHKKIKKIGFKKIYAYFTHLLIKNKVKLFDEIKKIYTTDSIETYIKNIKVISLCNIIKKKYIYD
ncbi:MAG: ribose-phosphate diphosphokinase [Candidatus Vidania fulgoroideorum]